MSVERSGEYRGKTVDAAISTALAALRVNLEQVDIEIIRPGSRGVLGIGAEDAIIRVTVKPPPTAAPKSPDGDLRPPPAKKTTEAVAPVAPAPKPEPQPAAAPKPRTRRAPKPAVAAAAPEAETRPAVAGADKDAAVAEQGSVILTGLLQHMGLNARVEIIQQSELEAGDGAPVLVLNIIGDDLGVLIGRQNEVLSALEMITRLMVNQKTHMHSNFVVDVNGHRARRAEALRKLALRMAEQAVESGRTMVLEPMPPSERRIVHMTLRENPAVTTQSVGEDDHRKVTIIPVKS
jgi:spoIIIJ-associated protein